MGNTCEVILNVFNNINQISKLKEITDWINQQKGMFSQKVFIWDYNEFEVIGLIEV